MSVHKLFGPTTRDVGDPGLQDSGDLNAKPVFFYLRQCDEARTWADAKQIAFPAGLYKLDALQLLELTRVLFPWPLTGEEEEKLQDRVWDWIQRGELSRDHDQILCIDAHYQQQEQEQQQQQQQHASQLEPPPPPPPPPPPSSRPPPPPPPSSPPPELYDDAEHYYGPEEPQQQQPQESRYQQHESVEDLAASVAAVQIHEHVRTPTRSRSDHHRQPPRPSQPPQSSQPPQPNQPLQPSQPDQPPRLGPQGSALQLCSAKPAASTQSQQNPWYQASPFYTPRKESHWASPYSASPYSATPPTNGSRRPVTFTPPRPQLSYNPPRPTPLPQPPHSSPTTQRPSASLPGHQLQAPRVPATAQPAPHWSSPYNTRPRLPSVSTSGPPPGHSSSAGPAQMRCPDPAEVLRQTTAILSRGQGQK